jgi:hypothetical protein
MDTHTHTHTHTHFKRVSKNSEKSQQQKCCTGDREHTNEEHKEIVVRVL